MSIRGKLLLILAVAIAAVLIGLHAAHTYVIGGLITEQTSRRLMAESALLALQLESDWPGSPERADPLADAAGEALGLRVSIINATGEVLGDSSVPLDRMASLRNHLTRPEIAAALQRGSGTASRRSASIEMDMSYLARRVGPAAAPLGFVRLAVPTASLEAQAGRYRMLLSGLAALALLGFATLAFRVNRRVARRVESLARAAEHVASGRHDQPMKREGTDEIAELSVSMDRMRHALIDQMGRTDAERRLLASILSGLHEGILVVNTDRRVLLVNEALRTTLRLPQEPLEGAPLFQVLWDRAITEAFDEALSGQVDVAQRWSTPDGRAMELTVVPFADAQGRLIGAIGLFFDVSRLEALERVRRDFVADISHELRSPLASVRASIETLQSGALEDPPEAGRFLHILEKNASRMEAILDDLTDLSLIETGAIELNPERIDLAGAVREAVTALAPRAAARQVEVRVEIPEGIGLRADRRRLDQVLTNLVDNAIKFNRQGGTVVVRASGGSGVKIMVEDAGPGIPPDALDLVFHRFYRLDRSRSRDVPGTGLGLAIVKHLVRLHGGTVKAENREGGGTRFTVDLPAQPPSPGSRAAEGPV